MPQEVLFVIVATHLDQSFNDFVLISSSRNRMGEPSTRLYPRHPIPEVSQRTPECRTNIANQLMGHSSPYSLNRTTTTRPCFQPGPSRHTCFIIHFNSQTPHTISHQRRAPVGTRNSTSEIVFYLWGYQMRQLSGSKSYRRLFPEHANMLRRRLSLTGNRTRGIHSFANKSNF